MGRASIRTWLNNHVRVPPTASASEAISAWLKVAPANVSSGQISSVPDIINSNPATQSIPLRRPKLEYSNNGLPCMRFAGDGCVLVWPITAQSSGTNYAGWAMWVKTNAILAGDQRLLRISSGTGAATGSKFTMSLAASNLEARASSNGTDANTNTSSASIDTGWHFLTAEYNKDGATDTDKMTLSIDGAVVSGTAAGSATLTTLFAATGNIFIGNAANDGVGSSSFAGLIGPDIFAFNAKMSGATVGVLTTAARVALMNYSRPT